MHLNRHSGRSSGGIAVFQFSNPTFWLNLTNIGLGVATLACVIILARMLMKDLRDHSAARKTVRGH
jgi:hypothetical protein